MGATAGSSSSAAAGTRPQILLLSACYPCADKSAQATKARAMLAVSELNRLEDLASLRDTWRRLLLATPNYSFFQTLEWLQTTWNHYPLPQKLRLLVIERQAEPIAI